MWGLRGKNPDYDKVFKLLKRRLDWEANWQDVDLLYQQLRKDKAFKKELFRKAIHLSSLWIPAAIYFMPKIVLIPILLVILIGNVILEYGNFKKYTWARKSFGVLFFSKCNTFDCPARTNFRAFMTIIITKCFAVIQMHKRLINRCRFNNLHRTILHT